MLALAGVLVVAAPARAQLPPFSGGRPNLTSAPASLPAGQLAVEGGVSWSGDPPGRADALTVPLKLRAGLGHRLEVELQLDGFAWVDEPRAAGEAGLGDGVVVGRLVLDEGGPYWGGVAIELGTSVPLATERPELGSGKPSPYALLAVELLPLEAVWIDLNLGVQFSPVRGRARSFREAPFASVAVGLEFRERLWPYVELGWFATPGDGAGDLLLGDAGLIWQASERLFVDVAVYFPLGREAPDLGITIGFVLLFEPLGVEERS